MDTNSSKQRQQFYRDYASGQWSMSELCDRHQISMHALLPGSSVHVKTFPIEIELRCPNDQ
jgi:hypothetical protein